MFFFLFFFLSILTSMSAQTHPVTQHSPTSSSSQGYGQPLDFTNISSKLRGGDLTSCTLSFDQQDKFHLNFTHYLRVTFKVL